MPRKALSPLIGLGIPGLAILVVMPMLASTDVRVLGVPLLWFWLFLWIPLTSVCLATAWTFIDSREQEQAEEESA